MGTWPGSSAHSCTCPPLRVPDGQGAHHSRPRTQQLRNRAEDQRRNRVAGKSSRIHPESERRGMIAPTLNSVHNRQEERSHDN